ncbi:MAG: DUF222 domain-containing protein [Blastococcus sp.]
MIEQRTTPPSGVSLFEAILGRRLLELRGLRFELTECALPKTRRAAGEPVRLEGIEDASRRPAGAQHEAPREGAAEESEPDASESPDLEATPAEALPARFGAFRAMVEAGADQLAVARAAHVEQCRQAGVQARAVAAFAAQRPAAVLDRPDEEVGSAAAASRAARPAALTAVSEWAVDEVMVALGLSSLAATGLLADSITLAERLPATLAALEAGRISWPHARAMAELVGPVKDEARGEVEARLLARVEGKTVSQLRVAARRAVLCADAAAHTKRLAAAIRERSVRTFPGRDGMGTLAGTMPIPLLEACKGKLRAYAEECATPGDKRTLDQRMLDCLADLILRPGETDLPPVQATLTIVATAATLTGGDEPGEVNGQPVSALEIRELAYALGLLPRPEATEPPEPVIRVDEVTTDEVATDEVATDEATTDEATTDEATTDGSSAAMSIAAEGLSQLLALRDIAGTALAELPHIAIVDQISGQLLALTNASQIRHAATCGHPRCRTGKRVCNHPPAGPALGPPPPSSAYSPSDPLARFVRARDRRCRFPGCRAAAIRCDLDHNLPWPHGSTSADNLCCLCRHHHRLSHQAPGWTMTRLPDGGLQWTTPGGDTVSTHPVGYGTDDDLPPLPPPDQPAATAVREPMGILEYLRNWPLPPDPDEGPAPF